ncbi:MAG: dTMP kinase [Bdellovibrionales bacterium]
MSGFFISLEGIDGAGKTTLSNNLIKALKQRGHMVMACHDMKSTQHSFELYKLVSNDKHKWPALSQLFMFNAGRHDAVENTIKPALTDGWVVICDRFSDSMMAYQGYGAGLPKPLIATLDGATVGSCRPNLTYLLDIDPAVSMQRIAARNEELSRMELESLDFRRRVAAGFREIAANEPNRFVVIDATLTADEVFAKAWPELERRLPPVTPATEAPVQS